MPTQNAVDVTFSGYYPGVIGEITRLHATYYHDHWGFDISFETQVGRELSEFMRDFREDRDLLVAARVNRRFAGAIAIDGHSQIAGEARLRWFIVHPDFQSLGLGQKLIRQAIEFCRQAGFCRVILWTFQGLDSARRLYESAGFVLTEQHEVRQWGSNIAEQKFELGLYY